MNDLPNPTLASTAVLLRDIATRQDDPYIAAHADLVASAEQRALDAELDATKRAIEATARFDIEAERDNAIAESGCWKATANAQAARHSAEDFGKARRFKAICDERDIARANSAANRQAAEGTMAALVKCRAERDSLKADVERHMAIASEHIAETERLREALATLRDKAQDMPWWGVREYAGKALQETAGE